MLFVTLAAAIFPKGGAVGLVPARQQPREATSAHRTVGPETLLWDGIDILDVEDAKENTVRFGQMKTSHLTAEPVPVVPHGSHGSSGQHTVVGVEVMGLQDTGTNLLSGLMGKNFGAQVLHYDALFTDERHGVWKHANMQVVDETAPQAFTNLEAHHVVPLVMVRNPLSWLQSIKKAPYELAECVKGDNWLTRPCTHKLPAGYKLTVESKTYRHLSGIWGRWTSGYEPALAKHFPKIIVMTYENLVLHTSTTIKQIAGELNLTLPSKIDVMDAPAKDHGAAVGHQAALSKIANQDYLADFTDEELRTVCVQLMFYKELLMKYKFFDCFYVLNREGEILGKSAANGRKTGAQSGDTGATSVSHEEIQS